MFYHKLLPQPKTGTCKGAYHHTAGGCITTVKPGLYPAKEKQQSVAPEEME
jgi:hypothetical protein